MASAWQQPDNCMATAWQLCGNCIMQLVCLLCFLELLIAADVGHEPVIMATGHQPPPAPQPLTIRTMGQFTPQKCRGCGYVERNRRDGGVKHCLTCGLLWCSPCGSLSNLPPGWGRRAWRLVMRLSVNRHRCWGCVVLPNRYGPVLPAPPPPPRWPYPRPNPGDDGAGRAVAASGHDPA